MKFWNYSLWLGIASQCILFVMSVSPNNYNAFSWSQLQGQAEVTFFPVMCVCWISSLSAVTLNNVFLHKGYVSNNLHLSELKKYLPSILSVPGFFSFVWFCIRWYNSSKV